MCRELQRQLKLITMKEEIIWPKSNCTFAASLINVKLAMARLHGFCEEIYQTLQQRGVEIIFDDSKASLGQN